MYASNGFRKFEIGDVDIVHHDGVYHLFHLTLPNHDFIAHAVSEDGLHWRRVKNALFIGDPPSWDDDMLWTMHVSRDPHRKGGWRLFYTGLCMKEHGRMQRIGLARSTDLYTWEKDTSDAYPLTLSGDAYETSLDEGRHWVSFRDPFVYLEDGKSWLLAAARVNRGPIIRRGCIALAEEVEPNTFAFREPLVHPMRYDDVEVPNLVRLDGRYYAIGSIREDIKVHYWYADRFEGPYRNYTDNVLLPEGNYAARISQCGDSLLVWNFFFRGSDIEGQHMMAPPKELVVNGNGELRLQSYAGFDALIESKQTLDDLTPLDGIFGNPHASGETTSASCWFGTESGLEVFLLQERHKNVIFSGVLEAEGTGKCGFVLRMDEQGDGYYLSLDLLKGIAQIRYWRHDGAGGIEGAYSYRQLQAAFYVPTEGPHPFRIVTYNEYIEFSLHGYVLLTLADDTCVEGRLGFYAESARIRIDDIEVAQCSEPATESYPPDMSNY